MMPWKISEINQLIGFFQKSTYTRSEHRLIKCIATLSANGNYKEMRNFVSLFFIGRNIDFYRIDETYNAFLIVKKAKKIYEMVTQNRKQQLTDNSCDFALLEQAYRVYKDKYL